MIKLFSHRKMLCRYLTLALLMVNPFTSLWAQLGATSLNGPGIGFSVDYLPAARYIRPEDSTRTKSTTAQLRYNFGAAILLSNQVDTVTGKARSWSLLTSGSYTKLQNEAYDQQVFPEELLGVQVLLQHTRSINKRWSMAGIVSLGLYTDMLKVDQDDIFINAGVVFVRQHNPKLAYGVGAVLTNAFGTPMVLPAFLLRWRAGNRFRLNLDFPEQLSVATTLNKQAELALALRPRGGIYDVQKHPGNQRLLGYMEISVGLENTWHLNKQIDFIASGGSILTSGITFREKKIAEIFSEQPMHALSVNYFFSAGIRWNFK